MIVEVDPHHMACRLLNTIYLGTLERHDVDNIQSSIRADQRAMACLVQHRIERQRV